MFSVSSIVFVANGTVNRFYRTKESHCPDSHCHTYLEPSFSLLFHFMLVEYSVYFLLDRLT